MDDLTARLLPPGIASEWTAMSYQEKLAGSSVYIVFALAITLVYLVLAGQYGRWITPAAVIFAVPLALLGTAVRCWPSVSPTDTRTARGVTDRLPAQRSHSHPMRQRSRNALQTVRVCI
jgi:multidrug efflux pump subunit AcrB